MRYIVDTRCPSHGPGTRCLARRAVSRPMVDRAMVVVTPSRPTTPQHGLTSRKAGPWDQSLPGHTTASWERRRIARGALTLLRAVLHVDVHSKQRVVVHRPLWTIPRDSFASRRQGLKYRATELVSKLPRSRFEYQKCRPRPPSRSPRAALQTRGALKPPRGKRRMVEDLTARKHRVATYAARCRSDTVRRSIGAVLQPHTFSSSPGEVRSRRQSRGVGECLI